MKKLIALGVIILIFGTALQAANRFYVRAGAQGQGSSWEDAAGNLQLVLSAARNGDEIWIAGGEYRPCENGDRKQSFRIGDGIRVYGGFAGTEQLLSERRLHATPTILSGNIGDPASQEDNSYTVVHFSHVSAATVLDGVTIADGAATGFSYDTDLTVCGAGIFNDASNGSSNPVIRNCTFVNNIARNGGAIYNYGKGGMARATITHCTFLNNKADFRGGAIYNDGLLGNASAIITDCHFENNRSDYGAGILNCGTSGVASPLIANSRFVNNFSLSTGSAVYNMREGRGECNPEVVQCVFENNQSTLGADIESTVNHDQGRPDANQGVQMRAIGF